MSQDQRLLREKKNRKTKQKRREMQTWRKGIKGKLRRERNSPEVEET